MECSNSTRTCKIMLQLFVLYETSSDVPLLRIKLYLLSSVVNYARDYRIILKINSLATSRIESGSVRRRFEASGD